MKETPSTGIKKVWEQFTSMLSAIRAFFARIVVPEAAREVSPAVEAITADWAARLTHWQADCDDDLRRAIASLTRVSRRHPCREARERANTALAAALDAYTSSTDYDPAASAAAVVRTVMRNGGEA